MFTKILVFLLLGSALALANPAQTTTKNEFQVTNYKTRSIFGTLQNLVKKADDIIEKAYDHVSAPIKKIVRVTVETGEGVIDYSKEKLQQLASTLKKGKKSSLIKLNKTKNTLIVTMADQLQRVIEYLGESHKIDTLEKCQQRGEKAIADLTEFYNNRIKKLLDIIEDIAKELQKSNNGTTVGLSSIDESLNSILNLRD